MGFSPGDQIAARAAQSMDEVTAQQMAKADQVAARQDMAKERMLDKFQETINTFDQKLYRRKKDLGEQAKRLREASKSKETQKAGKSEQQMKDAAQKFEQRNPELKRKILMMLRDYVKQDDDAEAILDKLKRFFEDVSL